MQSIFGAHGEAAIANSRVRASFSLRRQSIVAVLVLVGSLAAIVPAAAQGISSTTVVGLIDQLFQPFAPFNPASALLLSEAEYLRRQRDSREGITIGLGTALASFPLGASSAGFTYVMDPLSGERLLKAVSFGPIFVERALTNGRGVLNLGVNYQQSAYDTLQGINLKTDGFPTQSQLGTFTVDGSAVGDTWGATLDVKSRIFVFSGSYGLTDRLDFGWALPIASLTARGQFIRDYNGGLDWEANLLANGVPIRSLYLNKVGTQVLVDRTVDASGIGDIVVRGKYAFGPAARQGVLISAELRLPTGDEENLLGTGKTSLRLVAGGSKRATSGSVSVNGGYTFGGLTDEINFAAGTEYALLARKQLTLTFDFISQTLRDTVTSVEQLVSFDQRISNPAAGFLERRVITSYGFWDRGSTTLARAAVGAKYNIGSNWLITGSALFRLNDNGYQAKIVPFIGLEHTWSGK